MTAELKVLDFPDRNVQDIPLMLRNLADHIEGGDYTGVTQLAWVLSHEDGVEAGLCGTEGFTRADAYFLLAQGMQRLLP